MATAQAETPAWALRLLEASVQGLWSNCCRRHGRSEQKDGNWDFKAGQGLAEAAAACVLHQASCFWKQRGQGLERLLAQVKEHKANLIQVSATVGLTHPCRFYASNTERQLSDAHGKLWYVFAQRRELWAAARATHVCTWDIRWCSGRQLSLRY